MFGHRANVSGFRRPTCTGSTCCRSGFLLTMYTITGYDASAHVSEETHGAATPRPKGVWRSVFYSAVDRLDRAAGDHLRDPEEQGAELLKAAFPSLAIFTTALSSSAAKAVILISTIGQLFCGMACVTSASRMTFAFSRDGAVPGHNLWRRLGKNRTPDLGGAVRVPVRADRDDPRVLPELIWARRWRSSRSPRSRSSACTSPTRSPCSCAGAWVTRSRPDRGRSAASTNG